MLKYLIMHTHPRGGAVNCKLKARVLRLGKMADGDGGFCQEAMEEKAGEKDGESFLSSETLTYSYIWVPYQYILCRNVYWKLSRLGLRRWQNSAGVRCC